MVTTMMCGRRRRSPSLYAVVAAVSVFLLIKASHAFLLAPSSSSSRPSQRIAWNIIRHYEPPQQQPPFLFKTRRNNRFVLQAAATSSKNAETDQMIDTSQDPFKILGIEATSEPKVIQRAYKRRALQYHPDVVTTKDSSKDEKKIASDRFAKINWAYMTLTGKGGGGGGSTATSTSTSTRASSSSSSSSWTPPHRRPASSASSSYSSSSSSTNNPPPSTDWRDYMPKYDDDELYDANGDSLGAIFSDIILGVATGGRGLVKDFVEFLEKSEGFGAAGGGFYDGSGSSPFGSELDPLFHSTSLTDVGNEMDDTELMVQQLSTKLQNTQNDIIDYQAQLAVSSPTNYVERLQVQEQLAEAQARQKVVQEYLKTARKRLLALQTKYKELLMRQPPPPPPRQQQASPPRSDDYTSTRSTTTSSSSRSNTDDRANPSSTTSSSSSSTSSSTTPGENESWKRESFGSFGRGRSSSSSRARRPSSSSSSRTSRDSPSTDSTSNPYSSQTPSSPPPPSSSTYSRGPSTSTSSASSTVPPHRRTAADAGSAPPNPQTSWREDQKRLRDLQVEEEFQKLKQQLDSGDAPSPKSQAKPSRQQKVEDEFEKLRNELGL